jgi:hypothetical protein
MNTDVPSDVCEHGIGLLDCIDCGDSIAANILRDERDGKAKATIVTDFLQQVVEEDPLHGPPDPFKPNDRVRFVNVYLADRAYGGPEEGGWWYDTGELVECYPVPTREAEALAAALRFGKFSNEGRRPKSSVLSEGVYEIRVEKRPGHDYPTVRPHYE